MKCENQGIVGDKCVKNDEGYLTYNDSTRLKAWKKLLWKTATCWIYVE